MKSMTDADLTTENLETFSTPAAAWVKVIVGSVFMFFGLAVLTVFFRARGVFEIRQRSAYLVSLLGASLLAYQGLLVELHYVAVSDVTENFYRHNLALYFLMFTIAACYVCRVLRLGVAYDDNLRHALPWLMSEKFLVTSCLCFGLLSLSIPLYTRFTIDPGEDHLKQFAKAQTKHIWTCTVALQVLKCALLPIVWMVDDIFKIRRELIVIVVLGIVQSVLSKLAHSRRLGRELELWINPVNVGMLSSAVVFCLSVADPVRRLFFHPLSNYPSPIGTRAKIMHEDRQVTVSETDSDDELPSETQHQRQRWNYERIASFPGLADAFRAFAHRALCQESVCFLEEVTRYRIGDFTLSASLGGGQKAAFESITRRFIMDGSADEINISHKDKQKILDVLHACSDHSKHPPEEAELRVVFDNAYCEIRYMLEANILHLFTSTEQFLAATHPTESAQSKCKRCCFV